MSETNPSVRGEKSPRAHLTDGEVELIRALHEKHGMSYSTLAEKFEVSRRTINRDIEAAERILKIKRLYDKIIKIINE